MTGVFTGKAKETACFDGELLAEVRKGAFRVQIGKRNSPVRFSPVCGEKPGVDGWLEINSSQASLGFSSKFAWDKGIDFDVVKARVKASGELDAAFGVEYQPSFKLQDVSMNVMLNAEVQAQFCAPIPLIGTQCTRETTLAGVYFKGKLAGDFQSQKASGKVSGEFKVFGISSGRQTLPLNVGL
jgi:hypothetical protein